MTPALRLLEGYLRYPDKLRELSKSLCQYAMLSKACGYPTDEGIVPDAAKAALLLEGLADVVEESKEDA